MSMFGRGGNGHKFSDILRNNGKGGPRTAMPSHAGTRNVGEHPRGAARAKPGPNKGGVAVSGGMNPRSIPSPSRHMDGLENPVPKGTGQRVGSQNRTPKMLPQNTRLGNFGNPPGHTTMGEDGPDGMESPGMPGTMPANMRGKAHPVPRHGKASKPKFNIGDAHINHGKPQIGNA